MNSVVLQRLFEPCQGDSPVGESLEYAPLFLKLIDASERRAEQQYGRTILEAQEPDWRAVLELATEVSEKTRDLRVATRIVEGLCRLERWTGLATGLELIADWTVKYWSSIHPELDTEEDNDSTMRLSALAALVDENELIRAISETSLVAHRSLGSLSVGDYFELLHSNGSQNKTKFTKLEADKLLATAEESEIRTDLDAINRATSAFSTLDKFLIAQVGSQNWSGQRLAGMLHLVGSIYENSLATKEVSGVVASSDIVFSNDSEAITLSESVGQSPDTALATHTLGFGATAGSPRTQCRIHSRVEATAAIDGICSYFEQNEPASPVPLLLQRAKRMISMSFAEILQELSPGEGASLLQQLVGSTEKNR